MKLYGTNLYSANDWYKAFVEIKSDLDSDLIKNPFPSIKVTSHKIKLVIVKIQADANINLSINN